MLKLRIIATSGVCLAIVYICALIRGGSCVVKQLPDCNIRPSSHPSSEDNASLPSDNEKNFKELLLVSTLDGQLSALDPNDGGKMIWSHNTGSESMLSSSITRLEMTSKGQSIRLVPSLDGNLFKFNGKTVEPIAVSADTLLKSSFKLGDDVIISGGKDSNSYGINLGTGKLRYSCSMSGCHTTGDAISEQEDVLVVRRMTQTVRAVTPRTGEERWNFSVSEHQIAFLEKLEADCTGGISHNGPVTLDETTDEDEKETGDRQVKVAVPDGIVALVSNARNFVFWTHKFEAPIVHAWHLKDNKLDVINLFDQNRVMGLQNKLIDKNHNPLLYLGRHHQQLYIQQSGELKSSIQGAINQFPTQNSQAALPTIEWKPYVVTGQSRTPYINHGKERPLMIDHTKSRAEKISNALVLKQDDFLDYPYDSGFYLYGSTNLRSTIENNVTCPKSEDPVTSEETHTTYYIMSPIFSFWHWWKEVCTISLATSILFHVLYTRRAVKKIKKKLIAEKSSSGSQVSTPVEVVSKSTISNRSECPDSLTTEVSPPNGIVVPYPCEFKSRYTTDFEPIQRLGKGGFGVVFEARNKIDDCHYAVKRILLPDSQEAQEKVMREVRALAKLDHSGIVRYFNAWQETPPHGWQEQQDQQWEEGSQIMSTFNSPTPSMASSAPPKSLSPVLIKRNLEKLKDNNPFRRWDGLTTDSLSNNTLNITKNSMEESGSGSFSFQREDISNNDSFEVVFQNNLDKNNKSSLLNSINGYGDNESSESNSHDLNLPVPFSKSPLKQINLIIDSLVKNEDSGCADHSSSTEEQYLSLDDQLIEDISLQQKIRPKDLQLKSNSSSVEAPLKLYLYIQMQLCRKETLKDWLVTNINRERDEVLDIFDQIVSAVQYVHDFNLMHRDLKPSNIFFSVDGVIKVGDFGLVTALTENEVHTPSENSGKNSSEISNKSSRHTNQVGTQLYMSPEQIAGQPYSQKVDIFSLGLILFELLTPFRTQMERGDVMFNVKKHVFPKDFVTNFPDECALVKKMLSHNPLERPSALEIKKHPLFKAFQPEPEIYARHRRRRTLSQRFSSSGSDCDSQEGSAAQLKPPA